MAGMDVGGLGRVWIEYLMRYPDLRHAMLECLAFGSIGVQAEELENLCDVFESHLLFTYRPVF